MAAKVILVMCASAVIQSAHSAFMGGIAGPYGFAGTGCCYNGLASPALGYEGWAAPALGYDGFGYGYNGFAGPLANEGYGCGCGGVASTGGGLPCASASPIPPVGVSVLSENVYEGVLAAGGNLPFLGTVALEGVLPTAGMGAVSYGCGSPVGIAVEEGAIATGIAPHAPAPYAPYGAYAPGIAAAGYNGFGGFGYGFGAPGNGCGCGAIY